MSRLLLFLLLTGPCFGANAFVQKCIATVVSGNVTCNFAANTTAGNLVVIGLTVDDSSGTAITVTQGSDTLTKTTNSPSTTNTGHTWIYWKASVTGGTKACSAAITSTSGTSLWCREFSGLGAATLRVDSSASETGTGTAVNLPSISCTAGDLAYASMFAGGTVSATGAPWASPDSNLQNGEEDEYLLSAAGGAQAVNWTQSTGAWSSMQACFAPVTTVGPNLGLKGKVGLLGKVGIK